MVAREIVVYDADGRELAREAARSRAVRFSRRGRADQAQLDALAGKLPGAVRGEIVRAGYTYLDGTREVTVAPGHKHFAIVGGSSSWLGP